jgi:hypothetical protein
MSSFYDCYYSQSRTGAYADSVTRVKSTVFNDYALSHSNTEARRSRKHADVSGVFVIQVCCLRIGCVLWYDALSVSQSIQHDQSDECPGGSVRTDSGHRDLMIFNGTCFGHVHRHNPLRLSRSVLDGAVTRAFEQRKRRVHTCGWDDSIQRILMGGIVRNKNANSECCVHGQEVRT